MLLALAFVLAGCGKGERAKPVQPGSIELEMQDDAQLLYASPQGIHDAVAAMKSLGVDRVRITAGWSVLAPEPQSPRRPAFDARDPAAYPQDDWLRLDRAVEEVAQQGMGAMIDAAFWAPRWAVRRGAHCGKKLERCRWRPDPAEFGQFAEALARRYNGDYKSPVTGKPLPQVRLWTTWNEPNHASFLLPQQVRRHGEWVPVSAHWYRAMHETGFAAIKRVSPDNKVLIGGLAALAEKPPGPGHTTRPLRFVRELACVDAALRPLRGRRECRTFRPLDADGFAIHPYVRKRPPNQHLPNPDDVGISDLDRLSSLLEKLYRRGRIVRRLPIYVTEFGYETNPPDPVHGIPLLNQAAWLNEAAAILLRRGGIRMQSHFLLRDLPDDHLFQTGLILPDGTHKPAMTTFKLPFWIFGRLAIGRVYPAGGEVSVGLEVYRPGPRTWTPVGKPLRTDRNGVVRFRLGRVGVYRLRWGADVSLPAATSPPAAPAG